MTTEANAAVRRRYDRLSALYDLLEAPMERMAMANWRRSIIDLVKGPKVLEVGAGTGKNLPYYPAGLAITAIDLSPRMLARSETKPCASPVERQVMDVERLAFTDDCFDTVLATCVFCSVADPVQGLRELRRVVKPDGRILLLEHVRPGNQALAWWFDRLNPIISRLLGPNINRDTVTNIRQAGLVIEEETNLASDIVKMLRCRKAGW